MQRSSAINNKSISGIRKAVILLKLLGENVSNKVRRNLTFAERKKIDDYKTRIKKISNKETDIVLTEFHDYFQRLKWEINNANPLLWLIELLLLTFVILFISGSIFLLFQKYTANESVVSFVQSFFDANGIYLLMFPLVVFIAQANYHMGPIRLLIHRCDNFLTDIGIGLIGAILIFVLLTVASEQPESIHTNKPKNYFFIAMIINTTFIGPLIEEIFFRKWLYTTLKKNTGLIYAMVLSSLLFALLHGLSSWMFLCVSFLSGLILAYIYQKRNTILPCFIAHSLANLGSFILFFA